MALEIARHVGELSNRTIGWVVMEREGRCSSCKTDRLVIDPPYQRGSVWTVPQQQAWIETILDNLPRPPIFVNQRDWVKLDHTYMDGTVVIDGRQRLEATFGFLADEFPVRGEYWSEQSETFHNKFMLLPFPTVLCHFETERECAELYVRLLRTGTAHSEEEIAKAEELLDDGR